MFCTVFEACFVSIFLVSIWEFSSFEPMRSLVQTPHLGDSQISFITETHTFVRMSANFQEQVRYICRGHIVLLMSVGLKWIRFVVSVLPSVRPSPLSCLLYKEMSAHYLEKFLSQSFYILHDDWSWWCHDLAFIFYIIIGIDRDPYWHWVY